MSDAHKRGPEKPLNTRPRLSTPQEPTEKPTRFANMSLGLNATFCNIVGLVFTLTGAFMSEWLGAAGWILTVFGIVVLLWSFMITLYANRRVSRRAEVGRVIKINLVIILVGLVVLIIPDTMTSDGKIMLAAWTFVTAGFTAAQFVAAKGLAPAS